LSGALPGISRVVVATGSFTAGVGVDTIVPTQAAVPEPAACAAMALNLGLSSCIRRRH
jgi:hypothetical protein